MHRFQFQTEITLTKFSFYWYYWLQIATAQYQRCSKNWRDFLFQYEKLKKAFLTVYDETKNDKKTFKFICIWINLEFSLCGKLISPSSDHSNLSFSVEKSILFVLRKDLFLLLTQSTNISLIFSAHSFNSFF